MGYSIYKHNKKIKLESGKILDSLEIAYTTEGKLNKEKNNVIWVCHALTANSDVSDWWSGLVGEGKLFNPKKYFIVCANIIGSCYGTTGPLSVNNVTKKPYYSSFPLLTIRDMVKAHILLRKHLGIKEIFLGAGGSMGAYQLMEWAIEEPKLFSKLFLIATSASESAWGIAIHSAQRLAIEADDSWGATSPKAGAKGLKAARAIGMLTYRNYEAFEATQKDSDSKIDNFKASSYINYQGEKLVNRFNAYSYYTLSKAMDSHNVGRKRGGIEKALRLIKCKTLVVGISSDILCPTIEQKKIVKYIPNSQYKEIQSSFGHDGFLVETEKIAKLVRNVFKLR